MNNRFVKALRSCSGQETSDRYRKSWIAQLLMGKKKERKVGGGITWTLSGGEFFKWQVLKEMSKAMAGGRMTDYSCQLREGMVGLEEKVTQFKTVG